MTRDVWKVGGTPTNTLTYSFDPNGNLTGATDKNGTVSYAYDALNRATGQTDVWGLALTVSYDAAGNRTLVQDSKGGVTSYLYGHGDRLTGVPFGGSGQAPLGADLGYDNRNEVTTLTRYSDLAGTTVVGTTAPRHDDARPVAAIPLQNTR